MKDEKELNLYDKFLKERQEMLDRVPEEERKRIELEINVFLAKLFNENKKKGNQYFKYDPILENEWIKKYFPIIATAGDRNIGKTTSLKEQYRKKVANGRRFMHLRNINDETIEQVRSDEEVFLNPMLWENTGTAKMPVITDMNENIVGWYRDINTIAKFKSIEFPKTGIVGYEEFNTEVRVTKDKFRRFSEFVTTLQRHQKDLQVILQANFVSQDDQMLQYLGVGLEKLDNKLCVINWITGAIVIFIPKGVYKSTSDDIEEKAKYLGYMLALSDFETWSKQYGGEFLSHHDTNIINQSNINAVEKCEFNIALSRTTADPIILSMYKAYDKKGEIVNFFSSKMGDNNAPVFVFDPMSELRYINAVRLEPTALDYLINEWKSDNIKTASSDIYDLVLRVFSSAKKIIEQVEWKVQELEDFV